jgi:flagellar hook-associated protein 3 FlgL
MPIISRISTYSVHQRSLSDFNIVQSRMVNVQGQISSGIKAQDFKGLNGQVEQFTGLEARMRKVKLYSQNNAESISRVQTMRNATAEIINIVDDIENLITLRRNSANANNIAFDQQMRSMRGTLSKELNITLGGRFLFGGTRTDTPPVIDEPVPETIQEGVPDTVYYRGSQDNIIYRPQDNFEKEFNVRADDPAFQKIFAAISLSLKGHAEKDDAKIDQSLTLLQQGLQEVIALQARMDADIVNLEQINDRHDATFLYIKGITESIANTNIVEASTQLAVDEATLTASFQAFARVNNLRLVDFLR